MRLRRTIGAVACVASALAVSACRSGAGAGGDTDAVAETPAPPFAEVAAGYNERAAMLERVWARCSVAFNYEDEDGRRRTEQGEGHLQIVQPGRLALSVGKLGETLLWVGGDSERYWALELTENKRAYVGTYRLLTAQKAARIGIPVVPTEIATLLGVVPMATRAGTVERGADGMLIVRTPLGKRAAWEYRLDGATLEPAEIRLKVEEAVVLRGELSNYVRVAVDGVAVGPRIAGRAFITHEPSGATVNLQIDESVSDGKGRMRADAFDFEALVDALGPLTVIDVDEPGPADAARSGG